MHEPSWEELYKQSPEFEGRIAEKGDLVYVTGKTRGKFGALEKALPGSYGLVISRWSSSMGTPKVCILQEDGSERATTGSCVRVWASLQKLPTKKWYDIWLRWMDETYIPVIVCKEKGYRNGFAQSRDGKSILVRSLQSREKVWLSADKVHPEDWKDLKSSVESCVSVRVPFWLAKKSGIMGGV